MTALKVLIVGNYAPDQQRSMLRFAEMLLQNRQYAGLRIDLIRPLPVALRLFGRWPGLARWAAAIDKYLVFPLMLWRRARGYDCVHIADHSNVPYARFTGGRPTVVTCHDLFAVQVLHREVPGVAFGLTGRLLQRAVVAGLRRAGALTAVSAATLADLQRLVAPPGPVALVPNALSPGFVPQDVGASRARIAALGLDPDTPFFLHVGGNQWYKNRPGVVRLFASLRKHARFAGHRLVLAGKPPDAALDAAIMASGLAHAIDRLGGAGDADLAALYSRAEALLFLSFAEGFGWPLIEAQACAGVVVASDCEPLRQIGGGACVLVDPRDPVGAAETVVRAHGRFDALRAAGAANAQRFAAPAVLRQYVPIYQRAVAGAAR